MSAEFLYWKWLDQDFVELILSRRPIKDKFLECMRKGPLISNAENKCMSKAQAAQLLTDCAVHINEKQLEENKKHYAEKVEEKKQKARDKRAREAKEDEDQIDENNPYAMLNKGGPVNNGGPDEDQSDQPDKENPYDLLNKGGKQEQAPSPYINNKREEQKPPSPYVRDN